MGVAFIGLDTTSRRGSEAAFSWVTYIAFPTAVDLGITKNAPQEAWTEEAFLPLIQPAAAKRKILRMENFANEKCSRVTGRRKRRIT